jgi:crotonobetainyl-CoA:carnitine CoA-transferase CaiB-like acyl-CoA transferase
LIVFYAFIKTGDVSLENFSPEVKEKLNIDYVTLSKINPQLIY